MEDDGSGSLMGTGTEPETEVEARFGQIQMMNEVGAQLQQGQVGEREESIGSSLMVPDEDDDEDDVLGVQGIEAEVEAEVDVGDLGEPNVDEHANEHANEHDDLNSDHNPDHSNPHLHSHPDPNLNSNESDPTLFEYDQALSSLRDVLASGSAGHEGGDGQTVENEVELDVEVGVEGEGDEDNRQLQDGQDDEEAEEEEEEIIIMPQQHEATIDPSNSTTRTTARQSLEPPPGGPSSSSSPSTLSHPSSSSSTHTGHPGVRPIRPKRPIVPSIANGSAGLNHLSSRRGLGQGDHSSMVKTVGLGVGVDTGNDVSAEVQGEVGHETGMIIDHQMSDETAGHVPDDTDEAVAGPPATTTTGQEGLDEVDEMVVDLINAGEAHRHGHDHVGEPRVEGGGGETLNAGMDGTNPATQEAGRVGDGAGGLLGSSVNVNGVKKRAVGGGLANGPRTQKSRSGSSSSHHLNGGFNSATAAAGSGTVTKRPTPGRPRNPNPPLGSHQTQSNLSPGSLLVNQGNEAREALGDHTGEAGRETIRATGGSQGQAEGEEGENKEGTEEMVLEDDLPDEFWMGEGEKRELNAEGKKKVERLIRGIAGRLARLHATTNLNYLLLSSPPFPPPPTFPTLAFSPPSQTFWTSLRGTPAHNLSKFLSLSHPSLTTRRMAIPTGARSLDIKARLNGRMREMVRDVSGLVEAEMKWTRPESMVQAYGVKVVGWPTEDVPDEKGKEAVPMRNPSNNSAQQNRFLLELVENGTLRIERATREDKEAFAESFANPEHEGEVVDGSGGASTTGAAPGGKKKRAKKAAGSKKAKAKAEEAEAASAVIESSSMDQEPVFGAPMEYPIGEPSGSGTVEEIGTDGVAALQDVDPDLDVEMTLQEGLEQNGSTGVDGDLVELEETGGGGDYDLMIPQDTTLLAAATAAAAAAEEEDLDSASSASASKRLRPLALNPDKDGLPRPRPKSFLVLRPDGSIVPTSQRQIRADAKRKGEPIERPRGQGKKAKRMYGISPNQSMDQDDLNLQEHLDDEDPDDAVIRALGVASGGAVVVDNHGESAANMFLRDEGDQDNSETIEVGDQDSAMVLAMMGDSAQMMRLMQQQAVAAVAASSSSSTTLPQQQPQSGGMGTYGPPPGTMHGQHAQMLLPQQLRHQRGEENDRTGDDQIMELYQVTGPDFSHSGSISRSGSAGGMRSGGSTAYDVGTDSDPRRHLANQLGRHAADQGVVGRDDHQEHTQLFNNFQMLNPYTLAAQQLAYRSSPGQDAHDDGSGFEGADDLVVTADREGDEGEIDVEGEMNAIGQFAQHIGGNDREGDGGDM